MRSLALLVSLVGCASAQRSWARPDASAAPAVRPLVAERLEPAAVAAPEGGAVASADGRSRTAVGPCQPDRGLSNAADDAVVACTFTPEREWREWRFPEPGELLDVYDGVALIARTSAAGDVDVVSYDIDQGRAATLRLPEPTARWRRAGFTRSGMVVGLVRTGTTERPRSTWVRGPIGGPLTMEPLPLDADDLGVEGDLAVCVGGAGAAVVSTIGWSRGVEMPTGTLRPNLTGTSVRRAGERVRCASGRCVIDGVARVTLRGPGSGNDPAGVGDRDSH